MKPRINVSRKLAEVQLKYGKSDLHLEIDKDRLFWVTAPNGIRPVTEETSAIASAIDHPLGDKDIPSLARRKPGGSVALLVDDGTRTTPHKKILPILIGRLNQAGIPDRNITAIVAVGTHRKLTDQEIRARFGEVRDRISFSNHEFDQPGELVHLGTTTAGTPIVINKRYYESDIKIAVGAIVPHMYAGWSGGAKMVQPGISGGETTARTHLMAARLGFGNVLGKFDNPVRRDMNEVILQSGLDFIINVVQNVEGELINVFAGSPIEAHRAGVVAAQTVYSVSVPQEADIVIASCHPSDQDVWQAQKPLLAGCLMSRPNGTVIMLCPCPETVGETHPLYWNSSSRTREQIEEVIEKSALRDQIDAAALLGLYPYIRSRNILFVSEEKTRHEIEGLGFKWLGNRPKGIVAELLDGPYRKASVGVIQSHAGDLVPQFSGAKHF